MSSVNFGNISSSHDTFNKVAPKVILAVAVAAVAFAIFAILNPGHALASLSPHMRLITAAAAGSMGLIAGTALLAKKCLQKKQSTPSEEFVPVRTLSPAPKPQRMVKKQQPLAPAKKAATAVPVVAKSITPPSLNEMQTSFSKKEGNIEGILKSELTRLEGALRTRTKPQSRATQTLLKEGIEAALGNPNAPVSKEVCEFLLPHVENPDHRTFKS